MSERFDDMTEAFHDHLTALGVPLFALGPGNKHPAGWQHSAVEDNAAERAKGRQTAGICALMGGRAAVVDVDGKAGADIADVQRSLDDAGVRVYARVRTPSAGGFHLYVAAPPGQRTLHANRDRASLDLPGTEVIAAGGNVFAPGTRRTKYDGRGYTILWDHLDQLVGDDGSRFAAWVAAHTKVPASTQGRAQREYRTAPADGAHPYVVKAVEAECSDVASTPPGGRNAALNVAAFNLGQLVGAGVLNAHEATGRLLDAAAACGLGEAEARGTIRSGLEAGSKQPRGIPESDQRGGPRSGGSPDGPEVAEGDHPEGGGDDRTSAAAPWPAIDPITIGCAAEFPIDALPAGMAEAVREVAATIKVDPAIPATGFLGVAAGCVGNRVRVVINTNWVTQANLYLAVVADSGDGKSPGLAPAYEPLRALEGRLRREHDERSRRARVTLPIMRDELSRMQKAGSQDVASMMVLQEQIEDAEAELRRTPAAWVDDVTPEQLGVLLSDNDECMTAISDEGTLLAHLTGMYAKTPNLDTYLQSWNGGDLHVDRKGGGGTPASRLTLTNPRLTLAVAIQPTVLRGLLASKQNLDERGAVGRLLVAWPPSTAGTRMLSCDESAPFTATPAWNRHVTDLLDEPRGEVIFTPDATRVFLEWHNQIEAGLPRGRVYHEIRTPAVKARESVARIAGLFAVLEGRRLVDVAHIQRAMEVGEYYLAHMLAIAESLDGGAVNAALKILAKLEAGADSQHACQDCEPWAGRAFTVYEAKRWDRKTDPDVIVAALEVLEQHGYVRPADPARGFGDGTRPRVGERQPHVLVSPFLPVHLADRLAG